LNPVGSCCRTKHLGSPTTGGELLGFPSAKYDDHVDSTTIILEYAQEKAAYEPVICPAVVGFSRPAWAVGL
jgi:hypothetical protein